MASMVNEPKMLTKFREAKQPEIDALRVIQGAGQMPASFEGFRPSFFHALMRSSSINVIAEYKRASPSKGEINLNLTATDVATAYAHAGAAALSVLTEETYFKGDLEYLEHITQALAHAGKGNVPLLRKDFILDPLQVTRTAATPASALLLIVRMLELDDLRALIQQTHDFGMDAVVEVFDEADLELAKKAGARIIQVNNRDLDTLTTDLSVSQRLITAKDANEVWISASGISKPEHLDHMRELGFNAALIGTFLMQGDAPGQALSALLNGTKSRTK